MQSSPGPEPTAFAIRFLGKPAPPWKWAGKAQLLVTPGKLRIEGRRWRPLLPGARRCLQWPLARVRNVGAEGRLVHLQIDDPDAGTQALRFQARDEASAAALVSSLPSEQTPQFRQEQAERQAFHAKTSGVVYVTPALIALNVLAFLGSTAGGAGFLIPQPQVLIALGGNFGPYTLGGEWWRLLSCTFLHAGILHLAVNMLGLWSLGSLTERLYGGRAFLGIYLLAGTAGSLASVYWHPLINSVGASGAVFGVLGALLAFMLNPRTRIAPHIAGPQRNSALVFIAYNLINGLSSAGIDNSAHVGGLLAGFVLGWLLALPLDARLRVQQARRALVVIPSAVLVLAGTVCLLWGPQRRGPEQEFATAAYAMLREDNRADLELQRLSRESRAQRLSDSQVGGRLSGEILPRIQARDDRLQSIVLPARSALQPLRRELLDYSAERRLGLEQLAAGIKGADPRKSASGLRLLKMAADRTPEILRLGGLLNHSWLPPRLSAPGLNAAASRSGS